MTPRAPKSRSAPCGMAHPSRETRPTSRRRRGHCDELRPPTMWNEVQTRCGLDRRPAQPDAKYCRPLQRDIEPRAQSVLDDNQVLDRRGQFATGRRVKERSRPDRQMRELVRTVLARRNLGLDRDRPSRRRRRSALGQLNKAFDFRAANQGTRDRLPIRIGHPPTNGTESVEVITLLRQLANFSAVFRPGRVRNPPPDFAPATESATSTRSGTHATAVATARRRSDPGRMTSQSAQATERGAVHSREHPVMSRFGC